MKLKRVNKLRYFDFPEINYRTAIGKLIRVPFKLIPKNLVIKIKQGPNKGMKWIVGSGATHRYWLGSYEIEKQILIEKFTREGYVAYDIGANVGFFSLLFSRLVGKTGIVYAFEPDPKNCYYLRKNLEINKITNVKILSLALYSVEGYETFFSPTSHSAHIGGSGDFIVRVDTVDNLIERGLVRIPDVVKIDAEGAELEILKGMDKTLKKSKPIIFISVHNFSGADLGEKIYEYLEEEKGYALYDLHLKKVDKMNIPGELIALPK